MFRSSTRGLRVSHVVTALAGLLLCLASLAQTLEIAFNEKASAIDRICEQVMLEAARRTGIALHVQRRPLPRGSVEADAGLLDGEMGRIADIPREFPNLVAVPVVLAWNHAAVYGRPSELAGKSRADLREMRIGIMRGRSLYKRITKGLVVHEAANVEAVLEMMRARQIDIAVLQYAATEAVMARQGSHEFVAWPSYWASEPLYFILHKKHAAEAERFKTALLAMEKEGFIDKTFSMTMKQLGVPDLKPAEPR